MFSCVTTSVALVITLTHVADRHIHIYMHSGRFSMSAWITYIWTWLITNWICATLFHPKSDGVGNKLLTDNSTSMPLVVRCDHSYQMYLHLLVYLVCLSSSIYRDVHIYLYEQAFNSCILYPWYRQHGLRWYYKTDYLSPYKDTFTLPSYINYTQLRLYYMPHQLNMQYTIICITKSIYPVALLQITGINPGAVLSLVRLVNCHDHSTTCTSYIMCRPFFV